MFGDNMTDGKRRDGHHEGPDGRRVNGDIVKFVMMLHMHVVVLTNKVTAKYIYVYTYLYCNKCIINTFNINDPKVVVRGDLVGGWGCLVYINMKI